jgi:putative transposase
MIEPTHSELSIKRQCQLLNLNCSTYSESDDNLEFMNLIDKEYTRHPFYGSRKMTAYLRN